MRIVVFCPNLIGDTVMATPTFRAIRRGFPGAELTAVIKPHVAPTLEGTTWFDEWIRFDPRSTTPGRTVVVGRRDASEGAIRSRDPPAELDPIRGHVLVGRHSAPRGL